MTHEGQEDTHDIDTGGAAGSNPAELAFTRLQGQVESLAKQLQQTTILQSQVGNLVRHVQHLTDRNTSLSSSMAASNPWTAKGGDPWTAHTSEEVPADTRWQVQSGTPGDEATGPDGG